MKPIDHRRDEPLSEANTEKALRILFIEDRIQDLQLSVNVLKKAGFNIKYEHVETEEELDVHLKDFQFDIVLCDKQLPGWDAKKAIQRIKEHAADATIVLLSGSTSHEEALKHIQDGATDYLLKDHLIRLPFAVRRALIEKAERKSRIEAEKQLSDNESRYRALVENSHDALVVLDQAGKFIYISKAYERITGYSANELLNTDRLLLVHHPEDIEKAKNSFEESLKNPGKPVPIQVRMGRKDGQTIWLDIMRTNQLEDESVRGIICNIREITAEKKAAEQIIQNEAMFRSLVENAPFGIFRSTNTSDYFMDVNPALVSMLGYTSAEELLKVRLSDGIYADPLERQRVIEEREKNYAGQDTGKFIYRWKRKDGAEITVKLVGSRKYNASREQEFYEIFAENITDKLQKEKQLLQAQKMEAVGLLAGGIAHDFNNLLGIIIGQSELLGEKFEEDDPLLKRVSEIIKAGKRAAALTRQLLLFSRKEKAEMQNADLNHVVKECEQLLERLIGENISLKFNLHSNPLRIYADSGQIGQVLMNLAINARDAITQSGSITITTSLIHSDGSDPYGVPKGGYARLDVHDTGTGISPEIRDNIFDPFFTTKKELGTGLGLSTSYGIVQQHQGTIRVASEVGVGSTFTVILPVVNNNGDEVEDNKQQALPQKGKIETILLAEDEPAFRALVAELLENRGYNVLQAPNGVAALEMSNLFEEPIHLLITDVLMPEMSGADLATKIKIKRPDIKVLFISGYTDSILKRHGAKMEGIALLMKPFSQLELAKKVREVLDGK